MFTNVWKIMKENKFEVENEINNDLICVICKCLMIKACQSPCGCRFCSDCIEHYLEGIDKFCPGTGRFCQKQKINYANDIVIDNNTNIRISEISVKCPRNDCNFKDELCMIENHMATCSKRPISCPFNAIGCDMPELSNDEMKDHFIEYNYCHSKLLIDIINNLRHEMESMRNEMIALKRENSQQFDIIELQSANLEQRIFEIERKEIDNTEEIKKLNEEIVELNNENRSLRNEITEIRQQIDMIDAKSISQMELINKEMIVVKNENRSLRNEITEIKQYIEMIKVKSIPQIELINKEMADVSATLITEKEADTKSITTFYSNPASNTLPPQQAQQQPQPAAAASFFNCSSNQPVFQLGISTPNAPQCQRRFLKIRRNRK